MPRRVLLCLLLVTIGLSACSEGTKATPTRRRPTPTPSTHLPTATPLSTDTPTWFRQAVLYDILPRTFQDSDGDGRGDLKGIAQRLDYLSALGVTALRLAPVFESASADGFETTDYLTVSPDLGSNEDLVSLITAAHDHQIRVILSFIPTYTSDQHMFFQDAHGNPASPYSEWYIWNDPNQTSYQAFSNQPSRPLLNLDSPVVWRYMIEVARYWMDPNNDMDSSDGIDGFSCPDPWVASPAFWQTWRLELKTARPDFLLMGESAEAQVDKLAPYFNQQFDALFDFALYTILSGSAGQNGDGLISGRNQAGALATHIQTLSSVLPPAAQTVHFASMAYTARIASETSGNLTHQRQAAILVLTLPGTPMIYYGEEIGMVGNLGAQGGAMNWPAAEQQDGQPDSLLELYRLLINQRRTFPALSLGGFALAETDCPTCLVYMRWDNNDFYLVLFNQSGQSRTTTIDFTKLPRPVRGAGEDLLSGKSATIPSNGRYTLSLEAYDTRVVHWGKP